MDSGFTQTIRDREMQDPLRSEPDRDLLDHDDVARPGPFRFSFHRVHARRHPGTTLEGEDIRAILRCRVSARHGAPCTRAASAGGTQQDPQDLSGETVAEPAEHRV
jgi:hypothetical protein